MTSNERGSGPAHRPRSPSSKDEPENFATQIQRIATQRPPPPPGKGIAMMVIAAGVVVAVIWQFTWGRDLGPGAVIDDFHRDDPSKTAAPRPEASKGEAPHVEVPPTPPRRVVVEEAGDTPVVFPVPVPGADIPVPEGIDARTAGRLRLNLNALAPDNARIVALSALRELPYVVTEAPAAAQELVGAFVVERLVALLERPGLAGAALDAGIVLAAAKGAYLSPLIEAAATTGLGGNRSAAAALLFLDAVPADARGAYVATVAALRDDDTRPEHLRRLAGRLLRDWDVE